MTDIADPGSLGFSADGLEGFIVRRGDAVRAYRDSCPHTGAPLAWSPDGFLDVDGELIQCALHGALFLIDTGECVHGPCVGACLQPIAVKLIHGAVWLAGPHCDGDEI